jgi:hypothetical protein
MSEILRPKDLAQITIDATTAKLEKERQDARKEQQRKTELREAFMSREIHPEAFDRINRAIRIAAEQGLHQVEIITFPCSYTNDRGRSINNLDPNWPESLEGFAKRAYEFYEKELRPLKFKLHAEVISFPDGIPGEIGLFLRW